MTIAIAYAGGTYGTYLHWCIDTLSADKKIKSPFMATGSSHNFKSGPHLKNMEGWNKFKNTHNCVRLHPKSSKLESLSQNLDQLCNESDFVIHMYPTEHTQLLCLNNVFSKVWDDWWQHQFHFEIDQNKIFDNWPVPPGTDINNVSRWIKREFLSFYMMPMWYDQIEWHHPSSWSNPKCIVVTVEEMLYDFESTLRKIEKFCNLKFEQLVDDIVPYHSENLQNQTYMHQDLICNTIIHSVINSMDYNWEPLSLCSESWLQWQLRNHGFEICCDGLDNFPTNSLQLKELLYSV